MNRADAAALKRSGNALFGKGRYAEAVSEYTAAIDLWMEPHDRAVLYANRSAARIKIAGEKTRALSPPFLGRLRASPVVARVLTRSAPTAVCPRCALRR